MNDNIRALSRGLEALRILSETGGAACQTIADELNLSRPTVYRILETLIDNGLIFVDEGKIYRPTFATRALDQGLTQKAWALWVAAPVLTELQKTVVWTCEIATFDNYAMARRDSMHHENPFSINLKDFDDRPRSMLTSAVGRAYLAFCPPQEAEHILSHLERFGDRVDDNAKADSHIRTILSVVRERGYALEQRLEYPRATSVAVPIRFDEKVLACIDIAWIASAIKLEKGIEKFLPHLLKAQQEIEKRLVENSAIWQ